MSLRVLSLSAPQAASGAVGPGVLWSSDPVSLQNACRIAAIDADRNIGAWGDSNWTGSRKDRRQNFMLLYSQSDGEKHWRERLESLQPNLIVIGAMSLCLPGAIGCARIAKQLLEDKVCIVLGGWHATETIYTPTGKTSVEHHASSPLRLMAAGDIPTVFDLVVSGDGEHVIKQIGEIVARLVKQGRPASHAVDCINALDYVPGNWIVGAVRDGIIKTVSHSGVPIDRGMLPPPCEMFGVTSSFPVFGGRPTAHVFSDLGRGCVYDCVFCSERFTVTGPLEQLETAADRLFTQLTSAARVIGEEYPGHGASAFVEDSTLLSFAPRLVHRLVERLNEARPNLVFGGQLTIDQVLSRPQLLDMLKEVGLQYLFVGIETLSPEAVGGMSKDVGRKHGCWLDRAERAIAILSEKSIHCGVALIFGLGETHASRIQLIEHLSQWRRRYGMPDPISMNWGVQHPLRGQDGQTAYKYTEWGIPEGPFQEAFADFGEASVRYPLAGQAAPVLREVLEVRSAAQSLSSAGPQKADRPE